jgi:spoIIIJ-associated protein
MAGFLSKIFGGKKASNGESEIETLVSETVDGLIEKGHFDLTFGIRLDNDGEEQTLHIEFEGADAELLKEKEGALLDSFQLFIKRVVQHHLPDDRTNIMIDSNGYREESNQALVELAEKLKGIALEKGKSVYFRALPPKDRKVIHQYLANDARVKSRSIGDGLYKKIKIYPVKGGSAAQLEEKAP